ncbi:MAG: type IV pilus secretin PilQ [Desulfatiglandales bacterium]
MGKKYSLHQMRKASLISLAVAFFIVSGCVTTGKIPGQIDDSTAPTIGSVEVRPSGEQTVVEIASSRAPRYTDFQMVNPPRIIVDIRGTRAADLPEDIYVGNGNLNMIHIEKGATQSTTTRVMLDLSGPVEYTAESVDNKILLTLKAGSDASEAGDTVEQAATGNDAAAEGQDGEALISTRPRIFIEPKNSAVNQVLGVDFITLGQGKSRVVVTTDKRAPYKLDRKGHRDLVLKLEKTTIPAQMLRELDSSQFYGAVDRIKPAFSPSRQETMIDISLRELVPFHVSQEGAEINIDFEGSSKLPEEKRLVPLQLAQAPTPASILGKGLDVPDMADFGEAGPIPGLMKKKYTGAPMTMDFVNADVTNILRLIGEVSNLNIVWGPEVKGKVSMRLKNVPWDQALDLILANNNLAKRETGKVIWVTTTDQMNKVIAEEKRKRSDYEAELEAIAAKKEKQKKLEPIVTEFIGADFASADELKKHLEGILSDRGIISVDSRTNTVIIKDVTSVIKEAQQLVKQFDTPVKQIMIEARIVDATEDLTRDLGIVWSDSSSYWHRNQNVEIAVPASAVENPDVDGSGFTSPGLAVYGGTFSTNAPTAGWAGNIGLNFAKLTSSGMGFLTLDASLALAESEGKGKTISAPKVIAREGTEAKISSGDEIILSATENVEAKTLEATLSLTVTPTSVSLNDFITMEVNVTDDQAVSDTRILKKAIKTTLMVKSGETVVIGGIYKESKTERESGIPWLKDIPGVGRLFRADSKIDSKQELLIFLTPTVLPALGPTI